MFINRWIIPILSGIKMKYEIKPGANLIGADLKGANLRGADLEDIVYDDLTQCSEGSILDNYIKEKKH